MSILKFDLTNQEQDFKILNATNGGPWHKRSASGQERGTFEDYEAAHIPYSRNHDSGERSVYGGPYSHDIAKIFRNFDAPEDSPESYDFACTDESILRTLDAGTETFFRLGETIEHQIKKHATIPPKDFNKWARICEHIIRHYNEGWADGFNLDIEYWEIWNEPDLDAEDSPNKRTWGGTKAQFFDLYEIAAKHLKKCFPNMKIGGPALAWNEEWAKDFLEEMKKREVPIDFFSWHAYHREPYQLTDKAARIKKLLIDSGYGDAESILNEWNYIKGWEKDFVYSIKAIHGIKGAAFVMACISKAQECDAIDMLMYYDTRPSVFCGAFDYYTNEKLKGYYPLMWYGKFYDGYKYVKCETKAENIYALCGVNKNGKILSIVTYYSDEDNMPPESIKLDFGKKGNYEIYLLDNDHDGTLIRVTDNLELLMEHNTCALIKEV